MELEGRQPVPTPGAAAGPAAPARKRLLDATPAAVRGRAARGDRLRRRVRHRQAEGSAHHRVLRQPPLQGARAARELRRRPAGLAAGDRRPRPSTASCWASCPGAKVTDELGDSSLRARAAEVLGVAFLSREQGGGGVGQLRRPPVPRAGDGGPAGQAGREPPRRAGRRHRRGTGGDRRQAPDPGSAPPPRRPRRAAGGASPPTRRPHWSPACRSSPASSCPWPPPLPALAAGGPARAWDPGHHPGRADRAGAAGVVASTRRWPSGWAGRWGRSSRWRCTRGCCRPAERQTLWDRLTSLDPAGGYRPDGEGVTTALAWVTAGAVLAETPPERGRNHFFDPRTGRGLDDDRGLAGTTHALKLTVDDGGSLRGLATGTVFDLTGQGLAALDQGAGERPGAAGVPPAAGAVGVRRRAGASARRRWCARCWRWAASWRRWRTPASRPTCATTSGGPSSSAAGTSSWDRAPASSASSPSATAAAACPPRGRSVRRPTFDGFFAAADGDGLADRTQRRFFSDGTIPDDVPVDESTTPRDVVDAAQATLQYPAPDVGRLDLRGSGSRAT